MNRYPKNRERHGLSGSKEYQVWVDMRNRCISPRCKNYINYGGRGITVCDRWSSFTSFLQDMGPRPSGRLSIERIDNERGYSPDNCRWATYREQLRNTRRTFFIEHDGRRMCVTDWAKELGISPNTIWGRLRLRMDNPASALDFQDFRGDDTRYENENLD